jgi:TonB-linked SusC/RagA family outer membrane protein
MHFQSEDNYSSKSGLFLEDRSFAYMSQATGSVINQTGSGDEYALLSFFGKANYSYKSKYMLSATLRYDGSSRFGQNNRWGTFPAFSGAWRISSESFMEQFDWLSDLKLRASWGINGNERSIRSDAIWSLYNSGYNATAYGIAGNRNGTLWSGFQKNRIGNPDLRWEETRQTDVGFDFSFLDNKWNGSFSYYIKETKDMLFEPTPIASMGEGSVKFINAAHMRNNGFEFMLNYNNQLPMGLRYSITSTIGAYRNKVVSLPESVLVNYGGNGMTDNIIGRPYQSWYGLVADGLFKTQEEVDNSPEQTGKGIGRIRYKDLDGDGRIDNNYDRTWLGSPHPDLDAGLNMEVSYKNFDLTFYFQGIFGTSVYNSQKQYSDFWNITVQNDKNHLVRILDAWSFSNPNSDIPALSRMNQNAEDRLSSYFIENASFIKMRNFEIGYNLPKDLTSKVGIQNLRLYVSAHNLLMFNINFTGADAENPGVYDNGQGYTPSNYLPSKDMTLGLSVTF